MEDHHDDHDAGLARDLELLRRHEMSRQIRELVDARALLVAAISHGLRTPLTRIRMRLEMTEDDPLTQRSIADIREMDALIESALEIFRASARAEPPVVTDLHARVQALVDDLADLGQREAVMQPFVRLEPSRNRATGGRGLGLYIARDLAASQGGTLTLANRPEGGLRDDHLAPRLRKRLQRFTAASKM